MNILFLDFDGVVNTYDICDYNEREIVILDGARTGDFYRVDLASNVNELCQLFDLHIVVSSSWRLHYDIEKLQLIINHIGINATVVGVTTDEHLDLDYYERLQWDPNSISRDRGMQITEWLNETELTIDNYVVLDDNKYAEWGHEDKFIYCDRDIGFNNSAFERGLTICNNIFGVYNEICSNYQR